MCSVTCCPWVRALWDCSLNSETILLTMDESGSASLSVFVEAFTVTTDKVLPTSLAAGKIKS